MATVEALRVEIQQTLAEGEGKFEEFKKNATLQLASLNDRITTQDNFDTDTQDTVAKLTERMGGFDIASSNFAAQVIHNDAALKKITDQQTKNLEEMRASLENIFNGSGMFTALQNLVNHHESTIKELEDKLKSSRDFTAGDKRPQYNRSILDFKALSDIKILDHGGGFLTWADTFRNVFEQFNRKSRPLINFLEKLTVEQVELKVKEDGSTQFEAIFLYSKRKVTTQA